MRRIFPWLVISLACWVCAYGWLRATRHTWITGPHVVAWHDERDKVLDEDGLRERWCQGSMMGDAFLVGERLIVGCAHAFAWIDPAVGRAKIAWSLPGYDGIIMKALAIHDDGRWAVVVRAVRGDQEHLVLAIAGTTGWDFAPVSLWSTVARKQGEVVDPHPLPLALAWRGDAVELVLTRPDPGDDYGLRHPPELVRVERGALARASMPLPCCNMMGALPAATGWKLVAMSDEGRDAVVIDNGAVTPAPPALAWWSTYDHLETDRAAVGLTSSNGPEPVLERDGSRHELGGAPFPGFRPQMIGERFEIVDGVLRTRRMWTPPDDDRLGTIAQHIRGRSYAMTKLGELQLIGDDPTRMRPVVRAGFDDFKIGEVIPRRGGGFYWVTGEGKFVTLDDQLRRVDELSLYEHLRRRGSVGDFIDEPGHAYRLLYVLAGLPFAFALGLILSVLSRDGRRAFRLAPVAFACGVYAVTGSYALMGVLQFL